MTLRITTGASGRRSATAVDSHPMNRRAFARLVFAVGLSRLWLMLWVCPLLALAQTNDPAPAYAPNRFLLIVETSHPMQRRVQPLLQTIRELLGSNLAGQGRRGDTLGVWTFNEELYTGLLPLQ